MNFNCDIIDSWIFSNKSTRSSIYDLTYSVIELSNPNVYDNWDLEVLAEKACAKTIGYLRLFISNYQNKQIRIPFIKISNDNKNVYTYNDPFWINDFQNIEGIEKIQKRLFFFTDIKKLIKGLKSDEFEILCALIFNSQGFDCRVSGGSIDGGLDFYGVKDKSDTLPNIDNIADRYVFGQCKHHSSSISKEKVNAWLQDVRDFKNKKGYAYDNIWKYKDLDPSSTSKTTFYFCVTSEIQSGAIRELKRNDVIICCLDFLAFSYICFQDKVFDSKNSLIIENSVDLIQ